MKVTEVKKGGQKRDRDGEDACVRQGDKKIKREPENGTNVTG